MNSRAIRRRRATSRSCSSISTISSWSTIHSAMAAATPCCPKWPGASSAASDRKIPQAGSAATRWSCCIRAPRTIPRSASASGSSPPGRADRSSPARRSWCRRASALALCRPGMKSAEQLLREADTALYAAKARGRARLEQFNDELHARAEKRVQIESDLRAALRGIAAFRRISAAGPPARTGASSGSRRWCAGDIPSTASSRPATSFPSPRNAGSSSRSDGRCCGNPAASSPSGRS